MKIFIKYYKLIIVAVVSTLYSHVYAQEKLNWIDITLIDTLKYTSIKVNNVYNYKYHPSNLFDAKFNTCWVSVSDKIEEIPTIFIKLPDLNDIVVNIFSGYGKSLDLYYKNSMPKEVRFSVYAAVNPEAYVNEIAALYKAVEFSEEKNIHLTDGFGIQSFPLDFSKEELAEFKKIVYDSFNSEFNLQTAETCLILKMEILDAWPGNKYNDVCISEIFFNDRFVSPHNSKISPIENIYLNKDENTLLIDNDEKMGVTIYRDTLSVLQIIDISKDKRWAILISMPAEIEGRAETNYLLADLINKKVVNSQLEKITGNYITGNAMFFETGVNDETFLIFDENRIELR